MLSSLIFLYVWQSYDPTTHFETTVQDVLSMYTKITGKVSSELDYSSTSCIEIQFCEPLVMRISVGHFQTLFFVILFCRSNYLDSCYEPFPHPIYVNCKLRLSDWCALDSDTDL